MRIGKCGVRGRVEANAMVTTRIKRTRAVKGNVPSDI